MKKSIIIITEYCTTIIYGIVRDVLILMCAFQNKYRVRVDCTVLYFLYCAVVSEKHSKKKEVSQLPIKINAQISNPTYFESIIMKRGISKQISRGMKYQQRERVGASASASASTSSTALTFQQYFVVSQKEEQLEEQEQSIVTSKRRLSSCDTHNGIGMMKMRMKRSLCIHNTIRSTNQHQSRWFSSQAQQHVAESHEATSVTNNTDNTISANGTNITLKKLVRPFLLKFHPDRQHMDSNGTASNNTTLAREVNLQAIQTLNGMIDTIDQIYTRASSANRKGSRIELASSYNIEFLVTSSSSDHSSGSGIRKKKKHAPMASRRSVDLIFPAKIVQSIHQIHPQTGNYSLEAATELRWRAMREIVKLLRVAGLDVSPDLLRGIDTTNRDRNRSSNRNNNSRSLLEDELDFSANANARPQTPYEQSRSRYMQSMNWKEYNVQLITPGPNGLGSTV